MPIQKNSFVSIEYVLSLDTGEVIDRSGPGEPLPFLYGEGQIVPGLEKQLAGLEVGAKAKVTVEAEEAYGPVREELKRDIPRAEFPAEVEVSAGDSFEAMGPHGPISFQVAAVKDDVIVADFNHPLAGQRLTFDITVIEVREATEADRASFADCSEADCGCCSGHCH